LRVLGIDTALGACSACVLDGSTVVAEETLVLDRGHAEALLPLIERVMAAVPGGFESLDRVAVTVGPGSFTGLRVGISAARAIGLAAGVPVVGVTTLSAFLAPLVAAGGNRLNAAAIDARHGHLYFQCIAAGARTIVPARHVSVRDAARVIGSGPMTIAGSGAAILGNELRNLGVDAKIADAEIAPHIAWVARLGMAVDPATALPKPVYLRAPDAKPQEHMRIPRR